MSCGLLLFHEAGDQAGGRMAKLISTEIGAVDSVTLLYHLISMGCHAVDSVTLSYH